NTIPLPNIVHLILKTGRRDRGTAKEDKAVAVTVINKSMLISPNRLIGVRGEPATIRRRHLIPSAQRRIGHSLEPTRAVPFPDIILSENTEVTIVSGTAKHDGYIP